MIGAFIFLSPDADPAVQHAEIPSGDMTLYIIGCPDYAEAEKQASALAAKGCTAIELCAGFGNEGTARIQKAVGRDVAVGAVRFDFHPGINYKSGDSVF